MKNPTDRGAWWTTVHGVTKVRHNLVTIPPAPPQCKYGSTVPPAVLTQVQKLLLDHLDQQVPLPPSYCECWLLRTPCSRAVTCSSGNAWESQMTLRYGVSKDQPPVPEFSDFIHSPELPKRSGWGPTPAVTTWLLSSFPCPVSLPSPPYCLESEVSQLRPTLCDPMHCSLPAPPSMGFSGQSYWSGLPFPSPLSWNPPSINQGLPGTLTLNTKSTCRRYKGQRAICNILHLHSSHFSLHANVYLRQESFVCFYWKQMTVLSLSASIEGFPIFLLSRMLSDLSFELCSVFSLYFS